jgi:hypothetical protein
MVRVRVGVRWYILALIVLAEGSGLGLISLRMKATADDPLVLLVIVLGTLGPMVAGIITTALVVRHRGRGSDALLRSGPRQRLKAEVIPGERPRSARPRPGAGAAWPDADGS